MQNRCCVFRCLRVCVRALRLYRFALHFTISAVMELIVDLELFAAACTGSTHRARIYAQARDQVRPAADLVRQHVHANENLFGLLSY